MSQQKYSIIAVLLITALCGGVYCQQAYDCNKGCMECRSDVGCTRCYNSMLKPKQATETSRLLQVDQAQKYDCYPLDPSDQCAAYDQYSCMFCKPGYFLNGRQNFCFAYTMKDCVIGISLEKNLNKCRLCENGFTSQGDNGCVTFTDPKIGQSWNCLRGARGSLGVVCEQCADGYSANKDGFCIKTPREAEGCMQFDDKMNCQVCNFFNNYFSVTKDSQKCTKFQ